MSGAAGKAPAANSGNTLAGNRLGRPLYYGTATEGSVPTFNAGRRRAERMAGVYKTPPPRAAVAAAS